LSSLARYYDLLGSFQRLARWVSRSGDQTLTVHRKLRSERPDVPAHHVVHERVLDAIEGFRPERILDAGCGLGGTVFHLHDRIGGRYDGITLSPTQRERAEREARRRGVGDACRFHLRSYDAPLDDLVPEGADLIVAIESLAHSPDPARTIGNLARALRPGGRLAIVDDVPADGLRDDDPDLVGFKRGWHAERLADARTLRDALRSADLALVRDEDLTPLVLLRDARSRERRAALSGALGRLLGGTGAGPLIGALHGGMLLERLYARGLMRYRLIVGRRGGAAPPPG
jgi:SAM-dependent methyltransferase